jgi:CheY-like chemotaxis protein
VLGIVRSHRGAVRVTSAPGAGTTFRVWFPAAAAAEPAAEAAPLPALPALRGSILIVDDEEAVRQVAQAILVQSGCDVVCAADGAAALSLLAAREFDAVLLDLTMPLMSGDQVHALALRLRPDLRVVVSSGYSEQEATRNFRVGERLGFVQKPYTPAQLVDAVRRVLAEPSAT